MKQDEELNNSIIPADNNTDMTAERAEGKPGKKLSSRLKSELLGYGMGLAGTILDNIARQGISLAESSIRDLSDHGKNLSEAVRDGVSDGSGSIRENVSSYMKEHRGDLKDQFKDNLIEHGWKFADSLENDISEDSREFSENVIGHLSEVFGPNMARVINSAQFVWNDFAAMEAARNMRKSMAASDEKRDAGLEIPDDVRVYSDIRYGDDPVWNVMDIYCPASILEDPGRSGACNSGRLPVIINVHGGAWVYGDKECYKYYCMSLAQRGFAVVNFSYRLAPENKFPAPMTDINNVFIWLKAHAAEYDLDLDNMFFTADSAGANLAGLYICILNDPEYAMNYCFTTPDGIRIKAVAFNCGAVDPLRFIGEKELMKGLVAGDTIYLKDGMMNVTDHMNEKFPPAFLVSCVGDFCFKFLNPMKKALTRNGVRYVEKIYGSEEEPLYHVFHLDTRSALGKEVGDLECSFFREYI